MRPWQYKVMEVLTQNGNTHLKGASVSSMDPLMNEAMLLAASTDSSAVLVMVSLLINSSNTFTDFWFSALTAAEEVDDSMMSRAGDMMVY